MSALSANREARQLPCLPVCIVISPHARPEPPAVPQSRRPNLPVPRAARPNPQIPRRSHPPALLQLAANVLQIRPQLLRLHGLRISAQIHPSHLPRMFFSIVPYPCRNCKLIPSLPGHLSFFKKQGPHCGSLVSIHFFSRLSQWMASFVPMVCRICTSSTSSTTAASITRYL